MGYLKNSSAIAAAIATINLVKIAAGSHQMTYKKMYQKLKVINDTIIGNSYTKNMTAMIDSDAIDFIVYFLCSSKRWFIIYYSIPQQASVQKPYFVCAPASRF